MPDTHDQHIARFVIGAVLAVAAGCAHSPAARFYQLRPVETWETAANSASPAQAALVAIGPVQVSDYLDRPQMVTRASTTELQLSELHRWASPLESEVARVLLEDMVALLPADRFSVVPWGPVPGSRSPDSCRVEVLVQRFEGTLGDSVLLSAQWILFDGADQVVLKQGSLIREPMDNARYNDLAAAMSGALGQLGRAMASRVGTVCGGGQTSTLTTVTEGVAP